MKRNYMTRKRVRDVAGTLRLAQASLASVKRSNVPNRSTDSPLASVYWDLNKALCTLEDVLKEMQHNGKK